MNGKKILCKGNHDKKYESELFEGIYDFLEISNIDDLYKIEKREYFHIVDTDSYKNNLTLFFRGQADYSWELKPSIMRQKGLHEWEELIDYDPNTENLVTYIAKCQHYGKKTRVIDFSTDINVALFFACIQ